MRSVVVVVGPLRGLCRVIVILAWILLRVPYGPRGGHRLASISSKS